MAMFAEEKLAREAQEKEHKIEIANLTEEYEKKLKELEQKIPKKLQTRASLDYLPEQKQG